MAQDRHVRSPFHSGEIAAQERAGATGVQEWASRAITAEMPDQHREFYASLPFMLLSARDAEGRVWATLIEGEEGFAASPSADLLTLHADLGSSDPLAGAIQEGADVGMLGIAFSSRRRNRINGQVRSREDGRLTVEVAQAFGNCPQYIHERSWRRDPAGSESASRSDKLDADAMAVIRKADTFFIASGRGGAAGDPSHGLDISHRGGDRGFVEVADAKTLRFPDYAGNNYFNTLGNLLCDPHCGLLFVDFASGRLLHLSGTAAIEWTPAPGSPDDARRMIDFHIDAVVERREATRLRWADDTSQQNLVVVGKRAEADNVVSLELAASEGEPLAPFRGGQHLPLEIPTPGGGASLSRTYSLSNDAGDPHYRISVRRVAGGLASNHVHDEIEVGSRLIAKPPAGDFIIGCDKCPVLLLSAGIGITPMLAMLRELALESPRRPTWFVHAARNGREHAFADEVAKVAAGWPELRVTTVYSQPNDDDRHARRFDREGRLSPDDLGWLDLPDETHVFTCGPPSFMSEMLTGLAEMGLPRSQLHFEDFGPAT